MGGKGRGTVEENGIGRERRREKVGRRSGDWEDEDKGWEVPC